MRNGGRTDKNSPAAVSLPAGTEDRIRYDCIIGVVIKNNVTIDITIQK